MCEEQIGIAMMERRPEAIVSELFSSVCAEIRDEVKSHSFSVCILFIQNCNVVFHFYARILTVRSLLATFFKSLNGVSRFPSVKYFKIRILVQSCMS